MGILIFALVGIFSLVICPILGYYTSENMKEKLKLYVIEVDTDEFQTTTLIISAHNKEEAIDVAIDKYPDIEIQDIMAVTPICYPKEPSLLYKFVE